VADEISEKAKGTEANQNRQSNDQKTGKVIEQNTYRDPMIRKHIIDSINSKKKKTNMKNEKS
jgi:hypothetical protein